MAITHLAHDWNDELRAYENERSEITYVGRVVAVFNRDYRAMSDVYTWATFATVVTEDGKIDEVLVNANFECDLSAGRAVVDATSESLAAFHAHQAELVAAQRRRDEAALEKHRETERNRPAVGKRMTVCKGRKVPIGTEGTVAYLRDDSVLLKPDAAWQDRATQGVWVKAHNLKAR